MNAITNLLGRGLSNGNVVFNVGIIALGIIYVFLHKHVEHLRFFYMVLVSTAFEMVIIQPLNRAYLLALLTLSAGIIKLWVPKKGKTVISVVFLGWISPLMFGAAIRFYGIPIAFGEEPLIHLWQAILLVLTSLPIGIFAVRLAETKLKPILIEWNEPKVMQEV